MPVSEAFSPAAISSFFEICDKDTHGRRLTHVARIGARGGGFALTRGVSAKVRVGHTRRTRINIRINSKAAPEANTTRFAIAEILKQNRLALDVQVDLKVRVPIKAGYGTSAAGTLASCLALTDAANLPITMNELGAITHLAEVRNKTGLGTASALINGGFVLVTQPGAPGIGLVDRLVFPPGFLILCGYLGPISTANILGRANIARRVNPPARRAMKAIRLDPELRTFLREARKFGAESGFETPAVSRVIRAMNSLGAIEAAQNMIGEAVHGVISKEKSAHALRKLRGAIPECKFFLSRLDNRGAHLVEPGNPKH